MVNVDTNHSTQSDSSEQSDDFYIVGIGVSTGGLEALERMFMHMPEDTGMAFVVIQHVSPDFKSLMDDLLARHTGMPIYRVQDGMQVEPNSIYLLPPKMEMIISDGHLKLTDKDPTETTLPIDHLFSSMAKDAGRRSIAIVLSGTGSDGSRGIRDIREAGGLVIAQSEKTAKFDGMPRSATNEELVASNKQLQSTNEELQSVNEELYTVNAEYQKKIQELIEATADMDNLLESTKVHTLFLDRDLCIRKFTPEMAPVFNLSPQDIGRRIDGFTHHVVCDDLVGKLTAVLNSGTAHEEEVQDSDKLDCLMRILPYVANEEVEGVVLTLIDVSTRKQMQRGLDVERSRYEASLKSDVVRRDDFLAMLSHELRNPMGAVLNTIDAILKEDAQLDERHSLIQRQTRHMARLLDDLLDLARIQQNKIEFRKEPVNLIPMTEEVLEGVLHQFRAKDQNLHIATVDSPLTVFADPARLRQAQVNLLTNASKFTPDGGDIWYEIGCHDDEAVITVRDSGVGIPAALLSDIFDPFVQSDPTLDRSSGGMGVGLSLARSIIEAHGGTIVAESAGLGKGSTFRICLQCTEKPLLPKVPAPHFSFEGRKLLLVEDNDDARKMLTKTLRLSGFEVADTHDGQSALELIRSFQPDVAVIDIGLPGMDGYQLAREVRQITEAAETMLIALTGYGRDGDRQAAIEAGFDVHLVKPLNPPDLYQQISIRFATQEAT